MLIRRKAMVVVHGIHHQRHHPTVRHGEVTLVQGVITTSPMLRPVNGELHGTRVWSSPMFGNANHKIGTTPLVRSFTLRVRGVIQITIHPRSVWSSPRWSRHCMTRRNPGMNNGSCCCGNQQAGDTWLLLLSEDVYI